MSNVLDQFINTNSRRASICADIIEELLSQPHFYGYAESTLIGILDYIEKNDTVTERQAQTIENIKNAPSQPYGIRYH